MTWKLSASTAAILTLFVGSTQAADVFVEETVIAPPPAPAATWDGLFVGGHVGYGSSDTTVSRNTTGGGFFGPGYSIEDKADDFIGGIQVGYNWQVNDFLFGVIGDYSFTDMGANGVSPYAVLSGVGWSTEYDYIATIRGRIGWIWNDTALFYAHGGVAFTDVETTFASGFAFLGIDGQTIGGTETGWVAGAGVEAALSDRVSMFAEYSYIDFNATNSISAAAGVPRTWTVDNDAINALKVGINFKLWQP